MTDPTAEEIVDNFLGWLQQHPGVTPEDLEVQMVDEYTPYGIVKIFTPEAILNSRYFEISQRATPEKVN